MQKKKLDFCLLNKQNKQIYFIDTVRWYWNQNLFDTL